LELSYLERRPNARIIPRAVEIRRDASTQPELVHERTPVRMDLVLANTLGHDSGSYSPGGRWIVHASDGASGAAGPVRDEGRRQREPPVHADEGCLGQRPGLGGRPAGSGGGAQTTGRVRIQSGNSRQTASIPESRVRHYLVLSPLLERKHEPPRADGYCLPCRRPWVLTLQQALASVQPSRRANAGRGLLHSRESASHAASSVGGDFRNSSQAGARRCATPRA
jgi:hypothetical protein